MEKSLEKVDGMLYEILQKIDTNLGQYSEAAVNGLFTYIRIEGGMHILFYLCLWVVFVWGIWYAWRYRKEFWTYFNGPLGAAIAVLVGVLGIPSYTYQHIYVMLGLFDPHIAIAGNILRKMF